MPIPDETRDQLAIKFGVLLRHLTERQQLLMTGTEARILGHGGIQAAARAAQISETTVRKRGRVGGRQGALGTGTQGR